MARGLRDPDGPPRPTSQSALLTGAVARNIYAGVTFPQDRVAWAQDITEKILDKPRDLHRLLHDAEQGEAHLLTGFDSFDEYARTVFEISRQRRWRLKKHQPAKRLLPDCSWSLQAGPRRSRTGARSTAATVRAAPRAM